MRFAHNSERQFAKLLDFYGEFARASQTCRGCGWRGLGSTMESGETFGDGVDKHCPSCGQRWGFVQFSVAFIEQRREHG